MLPYDFIIVNLLLCIIYLCILFSIVYCSCAYVMPTTEFPNGPIELI